MPLPLPHSRRMKSKPLVKSGICPNMVERSVCGAAPGLARRARRAGGCVVVT
jgi:hypothetical protein